MTNYETFLVIVALLLGLVLLYDASMRCRPPPERLMALMVAVAIAVGVCVAIAVGGGACDSGRRIYVDGFPDAIVVGGGSAGCTVAARLASRYPDRLIFLIERGKDRRSDSVVYDVSRASIAGFEEPYSEALKTTDGPDATVAKMLGGGSAHNFALVVRGTSRFYDEEWGPSLGVAASDFELYLRRVEAFIGCSQALQDRGSISKFDNPCDRLATSQLPVCVDIRPKIKPFLTRARKSGIERGVSTVCKSLDVLFHLGPLRASDDFSRVLSNAIAETKSVPIVTDYNAFAVGTCVSPYPQFFIDDTTGLRSTTADRLRFFPNIKVITHENVDRLVLNTAGNKAVGVATESGRVFTASTIIVSAGGLRTPWLLEKSGVTLASHSFINHYGTTLIFSIPCGQFRSFTSGPLAFVSRGGGEVREWQLVCASEDQVTASLLPPPAERPKNRQYVQLLLWLLRPRSRGSVGSATSNAPNPTISNNFFTDGDLSDPNSDLSSLVDGMRWMRGLAERFSGYQQVFPAASAFDADDSVAVAVKAGLSATAHYAGACASSIKFSDFSVTGFSNLHVVDASAFPAISDGNTAYPVGVLSEIAADRISL